MKIQIERGSVSPGDAYRYHIIQNHLLDETRNIDQVVMYAERRPLATILVSGARASRYTMPGYTPKGGDTIKTKIKPIPQGELIGGVAWKYKIFGRIQKESEILGTSAVGAVGSATSSAGGFFKLYLKDSYITKGMNVIFYNGKLARVHQEPTVIGPDKFLYTFQTFPGETFDFSTWVAPSGRRKTCFGGYTSFGERSRRGYGNFHYPDTFVNHVTTQRQSMSVSGDVNYADVIWYSVGKTRGFVFEAERQIRAQAVLQDEFQKWHGKSSMRDPYGNLLDRPSRYDEKGDPIYEGDGVIEQISGVNDAEASGADGLFTYDDIADVVKGIRMKRNSIGGTDLLAVTGNEGMSRVQTIAVERGQELGMRFMLKDDGGTPGSGKQVIGYRFATLNVDGDIVTFVENPQWDDEKIFPRRLSSGKLAQSCELLIGDWAGDDPGRQNVEIRATGSKGINRDFYYSWFYGMTGHVGKRPDNPVDSDEFHMFKQNMIVIYNTRLFGRVKVPATA